MVFAFKSGFLLTAVVALLSFLYCELPVTAAGSSSDLDRLVEQYSRERYSVIAKDPTQITRGINLNYQMKFDDLQAIRRAASRSALESVRQHHPSNKFALAIAIARECSCCLKEANYDNGERLIDELLALMGGEFEIEGDDAYSYDTALSREISSLIPMMVKAKRSRLKKKALKLADLNDATTTVGTCLLSDLIYPYGALSRDQEFCQAFYRFKKRRFERNGGSDRRSLYYLVELAEYSGRYKEALAFEEALLNRVVSGEDSYPMVGAYLDLIRLKILAGKREEAREEFRNKIYEDDIVRRIQQSYDSRSHCNSFERFPSTTLAELSMAFLYVDDAEAADEVFRESVKPSSGYLWEFVKTTPLERIVKKYSRFPIMPEELQSNAFEHLLSYYDHKNQKDKAVSMVKYLIDLLSSNKNCKEIVLYRISDLQLLMGKYEPGKAEEWRAKSDATFSECQRACFRDQLNPVREELRKTRLKELGCSI